MDAIRKIEELTALTERLKLEAQMHAQEAATANATIAEIYQLCTGKTGEPGNWHGAEPVRQTLASKEAELAEAGLKYVSLFGELQGAMEEIARLKAGLKWYADGNHVAGLDDDWDTVSGEPQNWLCGPESGMVENGGVAKTVLDGGYIVDDEEIIAEPAMTAEQHKTKLARVEELIARNPDADSADGMELQQLAGEVERHEKRAYPDLTTTPQPTE